MSVPAITSQAVPNAIPLTGASKAQQTGSANGTGTTNGLSGLTQSDFLQLLVAQLQNQDPLQPTDNSQLVQQMSQFTTLSATLQLTSNFSSLLTLQGLTQGSSLIGKTITYSTGNPPASHQGRVDSVAFQNGNVQLVVNGTNVNLNQIQSVK
jgi:flagellar basal-body rod modification protein FlgD